MGISLEVLEPDNAPQVGITVSGLDPASSSVISVQVSSDEGTTWEGVRGAKQVEVASSAFFRDFVPPLNAPATYRLVVHSGAVTPEPTEATVTVMSDRAWISDPLNPRSTIPLTWRRTPDALMLLDDSLNAYTLPQPTDVVTPQGARLPVASIGQRLAPAGMVLHLRAFAAAQGALVKSLRQLFDTAGSVVIRGLPVGLGLDPVMHVIADVRDVPVVGGLLGERRDFVLEAQQVRPTSLKVVVPWWTYADVAALVEQVLGLDATYAAVMAAAPGSTYIDWLRRPDAVLGIAGTPYGEGDFGDGLYGS